MVKPETFILKYYTEEYCPKYMTIFQINIAASARITRLPYCVLIQGTYLLPPRKCCKTGAGRKISTDLISGAIIFVEFGSTARDVVALCANPGRVSYTGAFKDAMSLFQLR